MDVQFREIIDISRTDRPGMPVFPGDPPFVLEAVSKRTDGGAAVSRVSMGTHCGTHVDAPAHLIAGGATVAEIRLERLIGPAIVVGGTAVEGWPVEAGDIVLLRSGIDTERAPTVLTAAAAAALIERRVHAVGTDAPSIEAPSGKLPVHRALLAAGIPIIENLALSHVAVGRYWLVCLPLRLENAEAAPARAVLLR